MNKKVIARLLSITCLHLGMRDKAGARRLIMTFSGDVKPAASLALRKSLRKRLAQTVTGG